MRRLLRTYSYDVLSVLYKTYGFLFLFSAYAYALSILDNRFWFLCLPWTPRPACLSSIRWVFAGLCTMPQSHNAHVKTKPNTPKNVCFIYRSSIVSKFNLIGCRRIAGSGTPIACPYMYIVIIRGLNFLLLNLIAAIISGSHLFKWSGRIGRKISHRSSWLTIISGSLVDQIHTQTHKKKLEKRKQKVESLFVWVINRVFVATISLPRTIRPSRV